MAVKSDWERWQEACPVCGLKGNGKPCHICTQCGWERELLQEECPDLAGGANVMSLNEARQAYKEGREIR